MDNNDDRDESKVDWASYHANNSQPVDVNSFAALVRRVGGELTEIDKQSVSNSTKPALQINKEQLIRELSPAAQSTPPKPPPVPPVAPSTPTTPETSVESSTPVVHEPPKRVTPPPPPLIENDNDISLRMEALEKKITRMESFNRAYQKARKIKRGSTYKVSSNSAKGVMKDSELIAEYILLELAKGVKSITIKLDEPTNT